MSAADTAEPSTPIYTPASISTTTHAFTLIECPINTWRKLSHSFGYINELLPTSTYEKYHNFLIDISHIKDMFNACKDFLYGRYYSVGYNNNQTRKYEMGFSAYFFRDVKSDNYILLCLNNISRVFGNHSELYSKHPEFIRELLEFILIEGVKDIWLREVFSDNEILDQYKALIDTCFQVMYYIGQDPFTDLSANAYKAANEIMGTPTTKFASKS